MSKLREAAQAVVDMFYHRSWGVTSYIPASVEELHAALAGEPKIGEQELTFREPGVKIWEPQNEVEKGFYLAGWRRCAEGQGETQHCALLEAAVLAEREACAQICEEEKALRLAEIIRARGGRMTDKELLEAAAEAAGVKALRCPNGVLRDCTGLDPAMNIFSAPEWNPLNDDGDALRLAVKLRMDVSIHDERGVAWVRIPWRADADIEVDFDDDPYAATRRAIVRAAAEIGRGQE